MSLVSKKRQMWLRTCGVFALIWFVLALFVFWPFLLLAVCSALMAMIPVGVSDTEMVERKTPEIPDGEAWRRRRGK